jgi:nucleoside-diphosphate-sugar epimerase
MSAPAAGERAGLPTVLITGVSGVVGTALLAELRGRFRVIALTHRRAPASDCAEVVTGDLLQPRLGLAAGTYARLAGSVDAVVHAAGLVNFSYTRQELDAVNVGGTRMVAQFAADSGARLIHVSTAYVAREAEIAAAGGAAAGRANTSPAHYVASKVAGEQVVAEITDAVVVRPSIVIGDSRTGAILEEQGLHTFARLLLNNRLPFVPGDADSWIDFVPQDVVATAIGWLLESGARTGEYWLSGGSAALRCEQLVRAVIEQGAAEGVQVTPVRHLGPDLVDRLVRPAFFDVVPDRDRARLERLLDMSAALFTDSPMPSSLQDIPPCRAAADVRANDAAWRASIRHLIAIDRPGSSTAKEQVPIAAGHPISTGSDR